MKAQPKKSPAFPSMESVRERVVPKPRAFDAAAERKAASAAAMQFDKWLGGLASAAIDRTGKQRSKAQSVSDATAPVVLNIPASERGLLTTAFLFTKGQSPNAAFCGALATAITERLAKLGSIDFVGVQVKDDGASVSVRISDKEIPKVVEPPRPALTKGDTDLGIVSMSVPVHCATIEACIAAIEHQALVAKSARYYEVTPAAAKFLAGDLRVARTVAFQLVQEVLVTVREHRGIERPIPVSNGDIQKAIGALQVAARAQSI